VFNARPTQAGSGAQSSSHMTSRQDAADALAKRAGVKREASREARKDAPSELLAPPVTKADELGRLVMKWPDWDMEVLASHIATVRGGIEARIAISTNGRTPTAPFRLNVHSMSGRDNIVRVLRAKQKGLDWQGFIDHICREVNDYDPQEKGADLTSHIKETDTPWLIEPMVRALRPLILYGEGGQGKSTTALAMLVQLATCEPVLPGLEVPTRPVKSMILDWESDADDTQEVMELISNGANTVVPADHIFYRRMSGALPDHFESIQREVTRNQIELCVVDSIIAAGGEEGDKPATAARAYFDTMRALKVASIGITHLTHEGTRRQTGKPYGSVYYWNLARDIWRLRQDQEVDDNTADIGLFHEKSNRGGKQKAIGWTVTFERDYIQFESASVPEMAEVGKHTSWTEQIATVLDTSPTNCLHISDIYDALGASPTTKDGNAIKQRLHQSKRFQALGDGMYGLAAHDSVTNNSS